MQSQSAKCKCWNGLVAVCCLGNFEWRIDSPSQKVLLHACLAQHHHLLIYSIPSSVPLAILTACAPFLAAEARLKQTQSPLSIDRNSSPWRNHSFAESDQQAVRSGLPAVQRRITHTLSTAKAATAHIPSHGIPTACPDHIDLSTHAHLPAIRVNRPCIDPSTAPVTQAYLATHSRLAASIPIRQYECPGSMRRPGGSRGTKLKPPKKIGLDISIDDMWLRLAHAISQIQNHNISKLSYEEHYRYAYNLVLYQQGDLLYKRRQEAGPSPSRQALSRKDHSCFSSWRSCFRFCRHHPTRSFALQFSSSIVNFSYQCRHLVFHHQQQ